MDLPMPGVDGVTATCNIEAAGLATDVLVLTSYSDSERIVGALDAGAVGYLLKDADPATCCRGSGRSAGASRRSTPVPRALLGSRSGSPQVQLTARETEILGLVRQELAHKQIARRLDISERTVKAHLTSAFARIGVGDRTQAALWAERNGV